MNMGGRWARKYLALMAMFGITGLMILYFFQSPCITVDNRAVMIAPEKYIVGADNKKYVYDRNMQLIFIGGMPRSGTTLLRVLLDAHPDIRCGEETRVIPRLLSIKQQWLKAPIEYKRLQEAGITGEVLDNAMAAFILEIIARHGEPAPRLCNKDPFTLRSAVYLNSLFPRAKYILLIRDGRAVVHSIITRKVTITGFELSDFRQCMKKWSAAIQAMYYQCQQLGPKICLPVYYEQLVLHPRTGMQKLLEFLEVPWNDSVLHHEQLVDKPGGISLSKLERSTDQVIKPINLEALTKWVGHIPEDVVRDMATIAPMLAVLGYDPNANPPDYGKPDSFVLRNTKEIVENQRVWEEREKNIEMEREMMRRAVVRDKVKDDNVKINENKRGDKYKNSTNDKAKVQKPAE